LYTFTENFFIETDKNTFYGNVREIEKEIRPFIDENWVLTAFLL